MLKTPTLWLLMVAPGGKSLCRATCEVWAIQDSNLGPLPYQRSALTN
jgi:hypothetical protein